MYPDVSLIDVEKSLKTTAFLCATKTSLLWSVFLSFIMSEVITSYLKPLPSLISLSSSEPVANLSTALISAKTIILTYH